MLDEDLKDTIQDTNNTDDTASTDTQGGRNEASALEKQLSDLQTRHDALQAQMQVLLQHVAQQQVQPQPAPQAQLTEEQIREYNNRFLEDPIGSLSKIMQSYRSEIERLVEAKVNEAKTQTVSESRGALFWEKFKSENPELAKLPPYIFKAIIEQDAPILSRMDETGIMKHIKGRVEEFIKEASSAVKGSRKQQPAVTEGFAGIFGGGPSGGGEPDTDIVTITDALKSIRRKRLS